MNTILAQVRVRLGKLIPILVLDQSQIARKSRGLRVCSISNQSKTEKFPYRKLVVQKGSGGSQGNRLIHFWFKVKPEVVLES